MAFVGLAITVVGFVVAVASVGLADGTTGRNEVRRLLPTVSLSTTLLGRPVAFRPNGDLEGGLGFAIFQIQPDSSYRLVQPG